MENDLGMYPTFREICTLMEKFEGKTPKHPDKDPNLDWQFFHEHSEWLRKIVCLVTCQPKKTPWKKLFLLKRYDIWRINVDGTPGVYKSLQKLSDKLL